MARARNTDATQAPTTQPEAPAETQADGQVNESPEVQAQAAKDAEVNISEFVAAVDAVEVNDLGQPRDVSKVVAAYQSLDGNKAKAAARNYLVETARKLLIGDEDEGIEEDADAARKLTLISKALTEAKGKTKKPKAERKPVDPTEAFVDSYVTLQLAQALHQRPEGLAEDVDARVEAKFREVVREAQTYVTWVTGGKEGDEPTASPMTKNVAKLAVLKKGKVTSGSNKERYAGEKRNTRKHIAEAFANQPVGTFLKVSQIVNTETEEYAGDKPSPGAITQALNSKKFDVPGVKPETRENHLGAVKTA